MYCVTCIDGEPNTGLLVVNAEAEIVFLKPAITGCPKTGDPVMKAEDTRLLIAAIANAGVADKTGDPTARGLAPAFVLSAGCGITGDDTVSAVAPRMYKEVPNKGTSIPGELTVIPTAARPSF